MVIIVFSFDFFSKKIEVLTRWTILTKMTKKTRQKKWKHVLQESLISTLIIFSHRSYLLNNKRYTWYGKGAQSQRGCTGIQSALTKSLLRNFEYLSVYHRDNKFSHKTENRLWQFHNRCWQGYWYLPFSFLKM